MKRHKNSIRQNPDLPAVTEAIGWKDELQQLINQRNQYRTDGSIASHKTQRERANYLFKFFRDLHEMGLMVQPRNLREKHIRAMCKRYEEEGLSAAAIQTYLSFLRMLCSWIGKAGMIRRTAEYFDDPAKVKRKYAAEKDKSWDVPGVDKQKILGEMLQDHPYVGMQLLMMDAFGLRRKEAIMLRPNLAEKGGMLHVVDGTKTGKPRAVPIDTDYQRAVLAVAQRSVRIPSAYLGDPKLGLKENLTKFSNVVHRAGIKKTGEGALGITAHGLRAGYAMDFMAHLGLIPVLRVGEANQMPPEKEEAIRQEVALALGHNRTSVTTAYSGKRTTDSHPSAPDSAESANATQLNTEKRIG